MNSIERLDYYKDSYTITEMKIYNYFREEPADIAKYSIDYFAEKSGTSNAAIMRFCKKIGYTGFAEFKFEMSRYLVSVKNTVDSDNMSNNDPVYTIANVYSDYIQLLKQMVTADEINQIAKYIYKYNYRIKIIGLNRSGLAAQQLRLRLTKLGYDAEAVVDHILYNFLRDILNKQDLVIIFSISCGAHYENFIKQLYENGTKVIVITMNKNSKLKKYVSKFIVLPCISKTTPTSFLDDQALFFVFIEMILAGLASIK